MSQTVLIDQSGEKKGEIPLPQSYFSGKISEGSIYYTVNALLTNRRQGDASTKERGQVNASTAKPWRQKGTGRARAGMRSSPLWRGGGTVFGPHPKEYSVNVPKKVRKAAFISALSTKAAEEGAVLVVEELAFDQPKTSLMAGMLEKLELTGRRVLIMLRDNKPSVWKSARNIPGLEVKPFSECNAYDVLLAEKIIIEKNVIDQLEKPQSEGPLPDSAPAPAD
ncbi:MAG: 50S ribosomal protein L4 [Candidatus Glassbacteria bacterium]|nr:50S ribosomal protein L4 [Candidatus Glassbacteria bacterium]